MKYAAAVLFIMLGLTGCMTSRYAQGPGSRDSLEPPPMTIKDVIDLSKASLSDSIIISQIEATHSAFQLGTNDIIDLKSSGVSENVITAMIRATPAPETPQGHTEYPYYPSYGWYPEVYFSYWGPYAWFEPFPRYVHGYGFPRAYFAPRMGHFHFRRR